MSFWRIAGVAVIVSGIFVGILIILPAIGIGRSVITPIISPGTATPTPAGSASGNVSGAANAQAPNGPLPARKVLANNGYHTFQSFNNCAPAALSIALSYYGVSVSQEALAAELRPYNNPQGVNDDKSTVPAELAEKAKDYGLIPYYRPNGDIELLKQFIALDIPVVMRTLLQADEDFAHYRVVKGYDSATGEIIQDDSYQGKNLRYSYDDFLHLWQQFGYEYLVLVPPAKQAAAEAVLGEALDPATAWRSAVSRAEQELARSPNDIRARFNLSVALYESGEYARSAAEFEKIEGRLPQLVLWYQMQPIQAYFELGNYDRVFALTDRILARNVSYSELYILRGRIYEKQGRPELARAEFEKAVFYNKNSKDAREALARVS